MTGFVKKLCDINGIEIPKELLCIHITENQIENSLKSLSMRYAKETQVNTVTKGDFVYCTADKKSYPDERTVLIFTDINIPGAEKAAETVLCKSVGDTFETELCGNKLELTINKVIHRTPAEINDSLILSLNEKKLKTVNDYKQYVKEKAFETLRLEKSKEITRYILNHMEAETEFSYDKKEFDRYISDNMERFMAEYKEMGIEATKEDLKNDFLTHQKQIWLAEAFCKHHKLNVDLSAAKEEATRIIEMSELSGEPVPNKNEIIEMSVQNAYLTEFFGYIENIISQKTEACYGNN